MLPIKSVQRADLAVQATAFYPPVGPLDQGPVYSALPGAR